MNKHVCETHRAEIEESAADSAQSHALREHLAACRPCEQFRRERASLRLLVGGLGKVAAPADFEFRLRARMASAEGGARRAKRFRLGFVPGLASVALAACFVSVSAWIYLKRQPAPNRPDAPALASTAAPSATPESASAKDAPPAVVDETSLKRDSELAFSTPPRRDLKMRAASTIRARLEGKGAERAEREAGSAVFDSHAATILNASSSRQTELASLPTTAVAVRTSAVPLQVVLRDETGAVRVVPMRSVSFGSQGLVRQGRNAEPVSHTDKEGVW